MKADAMYRTGNRSQKFETSYDAFMSKRPIIRLFITATPVPALLALDEEAEVDEIKFWAIEPCHDYIGQSDMVSAHTDLRVT